MSTSLFAIISLLTLVPIIGLIIDMKRSKNYLTAIIFAGICTTGLVLVFVFPSIISATLFAFSMAPIFFLYVYFSNKTNWDKSEQMNKNDDILD